MVLEYIFALNFNETNLSHILIYIGFLMCVTENTFQCWNPINEDDIEGVC